MAPTRRSGVGAAGLTTPTPRATTSVSTRLNGQISAVSQDEKPLLQGVQIPVQVAIKGHREGRRRC